MQTTDFQFIDLLVIAIGLVIFFSFLCIAFISTKEKEPRAARVALLLAVLAPLPYVVVGLLDFDHQQTVVLFLIALTILTAFILLIPFGRNYTKESDTPKVRIDERDVMFARYDYERGSWQYDDYYKRNPEKRDIDDRIRAKPGLLGKESIYYDPIAFSAANASFSAVKTLHEIVEKDVTGNECIRMDRISVSLYIKRWAKKLGAISVGITELKDYHLYSFIGRGGKYGEPVDLKHEYAIAVTVEMDKDMLDSAPFGSIVMESSQQYLESGVIAVQIAEFIRNLGYPARAHIDGNYRVVCPLVARDAGLGEIGRMGLLMTPELGPRVRIAVVTTDLPLVSESRTEEYSMIDFCRRCKKCAVACPSRAIPFEDRIEIDGVKRWQIDSESCYDFWCSAGTDCGRCVSVCPYSHPDNILHNVVRKFVYNSSLFRRFALKMDDLFYGRKPNTAALPEWMKVTVEQ